MSDAFLYTANGEGASAIAMPTPLPEIIGQWQPMRLAMARETPPEFTRDEWAYLLAFIDADNLTSVIEQTFGPILTKTPPKILKLYRPRGSCALWLPNNVNLLGPLSLILLSLSTNPVRVKAGSTGRNLSSAFVDFCVQHLPEGSLRRYLGKEIDVQSFDRDSKKHQDMTQEAQVRIIFGSDLAAEAIESLPHPPTSIGFSFVDRQSESWFENEAVSDECLETLFKVFRIYGRAGCTSPRRVVLIDGNKKQALDLRDRLAKYCSRREVLPQPAIASNNVMAAQLAKARGWNAMTTKNNELTLAAGPSNLMPIEEHMTLHVTWATLEEALIELPENIQTIGHVLKHSSDPKWLSAISRSRIKRFVPLARMHHFGPEWDGFEFWRSTFEVVEIAR